MSKKTENLKAKNIIYYCVDDQNQPYKGVKGKGKVKIHEDIEHNIPIAEKIAIRYLESLEHPTAKEVYRRVKNGDSVILEIFPSYHSTWDYSKTVTTG